MCDCDQQTEKYNQSRRRRYEMMESAGGILPNERVATCSKHVPKFGAAANNNGIVLSINTFNRAQYSGVNVCGSVWTCPVCGERIGSYRANEVSIAIEQHVKNGGWGLFLTLTHSHSKHDRLSDLLINESKAQQAMRNTSRFKNLMKKYGYLGSVKSLETLFGFSNGWHNHTHEVMFIDRKISSSELLEIKTTIYDIWSFYCDKFGLGLPNYNGVDVQIPFSMDSMAKYVSKWGYELTHLQMKSGKNGNRTPFNILADLTQKYSVKDHNLFLEYARAFKGKKQLRWSRGLKKLFGIEEITDAQLDALPVKEVITIIKKRDWYMILGANKRAELLEVAEQGGASAVHVYIKQLHDIVDLVKLRQSISKRHTSDRIYLHTDLQSQNNFSGYHSSSYSDMYSALSDSHTREYNNLIQKERNLESRYSLDNIAFMRPKHIKMNLQKTA